MQKALTIGLLLCLMILMVACVKRIAPLSPHRTSTEAHQKAQVNQDCLECHTVADIESEHQPADDCLRCHRIVQGD